MGRKLKSARFDRISVAKRGANERKFRCIRDFEMFRLRWGLSSPYYRQCGPRPRSIMERRIRNFYFVSSWSELFTFFIRFGVFFPPLNYSSQIACTNDREITLIEKPHFGVFFFHFVRRPTYDDGKLYTYIMYNISATFLLYWNEFFFFTHSERIIIGELCACVGVVLILYRVYAQGLCWSSRMKFLFHYFSKSEKW